LTTDTKNKVLTRKEVPEELTWKLEDIFVTDEAWEKEYKEVSVLAEKANTFQGTFATGAEELFKAFMYRDELSERIRRLYTYSHMRYDQDTTNSHYQAMDSRIKTLFVKVSTGLSFMTPEILSLKEEELERYLN